MQALRWAALAVMCSCGGAAPAPTTVPKVLSNDEPDRAYLVGVPAPERGEFESKLRGPAFGVRYADNQLTIVEGCTFSGVTYRYQAFGLKDDGVDIDDETSLHASVPFYVGSFDSELADSKHLRILMALVGAYEITSMPSSYPEACKTATHVVGGASIGAFRFVSDKSRQADATLSTVWQAGVSGKVSSDVNLLRLDGDRDKCVSSGDATAPPEGCSGVIAVKLRSIRLAVGGVDVKSLLDQATDVVRTLSRRPESASDGYLEAAKIFWRLYWTDLIGIETRGLEAAMVMFGRKLDRCGYGPAPVKHASAPLPFTQECDASGWMELKKRANAVEAEIAKTRAQYPGS